MVASPLDEIEPLMTVIDVANVLGIPETTVVEQLIRPRRVLAERVGKSYLVRADSVRKWYDEFGSEARLGTVVPESRESA